MTPGCRDSKNLESVGADGGADDGADDGAGDGLGDGADGGAGAGAGDGLLCNGRWGGGGANAAAR